MLEIVVGFRASFDSLHRSLDPLLQFPHFIVCCSEQNLQFLQGRSCSNHDDDDDTLSYRLTTMLLVIMYITYNVVMYYVQAS